MLVLAGAIVLQGLAISVAVLVAQVSAESLASQAAAGATSPSIARAPISARVRERMHVRVSASHVSVEAPRLLPVPRIHVRRDVVS
jgi:hypothetical protein